MFAERKSDVDEIHEYLLLKGVEAVAIHGSKSMEERIWAVKQFKSKAKDVLVATDVASKGLDFPGVQHVLNYDMPEEIENYGPPKPLYNKLSSLPSLSLCFFPRLC